MRGFHSNFKKGLTGGLRPDYVMEANTAFLAEALNCRIRKEGLEGYSQQLTLLPTIYDHTTGVAITLTYNWPFPQMFNTDSGFYICTETAIYRVWGEGGILQGDQITSAFPEATKWPWTIADCPLFPVFTNGDYLVYYDYDDTAWIVYSYRYATDPGNHWKSTWRTPLSACYFRGQILLGGSNDLNIDTVENKILRWSDIGVFDFMGRDPSASAANILRNVAGETFFSSTVEERLLRIAPLGKCVIAYGMFSIISLTPVQDPAPTYSPDEVADFGIACPLAVGIGKDEHIFICRNSHLWKIKGGSGSAAPTVTKVGHIEWFDPLQTGINLNTQTGLISILYNSMEKEYYISNGTTSYIYNEQGLTEGSKAIYGWINYKNITSVDTGFIELEGATDILLLEDGGYFELEFYASPIASGNVGLFVEDTSKKTYMQVKTDEIDFNYPTIKTIESVDLGISIPSAAIVEVMIEWKNTINGSWNTTSWKRCNPAGMCYPLVSGVFFRVCIRVSNYYNSGIDTTILNNIGVSWKVSDKSGIRGVRQASDVNTAAA